MKTIPTPWFVNYSEDTDDCGSGSAGFAIGPHEDDMADSFLFSETLDAADLPEEIEGTFEMVAGVMNTVMEFKDDLAKERDVDESVIDDLWMRLSMLFREETR